MNGWHWFHISAPCTHAHKMLLTQQSQHWRCLFGTVRVCLIVRESTDRISWIVFKDALAFLKRLIWWVLRCVCELWGVCFSLGNKLSDTRYLVMKFSVQRWTWVRCVCDRVWVQLLLVTLKEPHLIQCSESRLISPKTPLLLTYTSVFYTTIFSMRKYLPAIIIRKFSINWSSLSLSRNCTSIIL